MTRAVHVLGIHDGHNCGATLVSDGKVVASVSEERVTRRKNEVGFPEKSIAEVLRIGSVDAAASCSQVVYASKFMHQKDYLTDLAPWYKAGLSEQRAAAARPNDYQKLIFAQRRKERIDDIVRLLGVAPGQGVVRRAPSRSPSPRLIIRPPKRADEKPVLGLTCDGAGDGLCATVSVCRGNVIERLAGTDRHASIRQDLLACLPFSWA